MKKLGIIGGAGPLASALFYETLVYESYQLRQPLPELLLLNYPFTRSLTPEEKQDIGSLCQQQLSDCLNQLGGSGVTTAILVCNTLHLDLAKISHGPIEFFLIPNLVFGEIKKKEGKHLLLLATQNTCKSSLYRQTDITIFCPSLEGQRVVDGVIDRLLEGEISVADTQQIENVIRNFPERIDGVILGCTDLSVLHHRFPICSEKTIYDSVKISAKTILRFL